MSSYLRSITGYVQSSSLYQGVSSAIGSGCSKVAEYSSEKFSEIAHNTISSKVESYLGQKSLKDITTSDAPLNRKIKSILIESLLYYLKVPEEIKDYIFNKLIAYKPNYDRIKKFLQKTVNEETISQVADLSMKVTGEVLDAMHAIDPQQDDSNQIQEQLIEQFGYQGDFSTFKSDVKKEIRSNFETLIKQKFISKDENYFTLELKKIAVYLTVNIICSVLLRSFDKGYKELHKIVNNPTEYSEKMKELDEKGFLEFNISFLGLKITKEDFEMLQKNVNSMGEAIYWIVLMKMTEGMTSLTKREYDLDKRWEGLADKMQPLVSKSIGFCNNHNDQGFLSNISQKAFTFSAGLTNPQEAPAWLKRGFQPSKIIPALNKGLQAAINNPAHEVVLES